MKFIRNPTTNNSKTQIKEDICAEIVTLLLVYYFFQILYYEVVIN